MSCTREELKKKKRSRKVREEKERKAKSNMKTTLEDALIALWWPINRTTTFLFMENYFPWI